MNRVLLTFVVVYGLLLPIHISAQILVEGHHRPLHSDSLQAYKLPYIAATDSGRNCIWDFSNLTTDSAEVVDMYYYAPSEDDTAHIGCHREHTNYYYHYSKDTLWQTAYETSRAHVRYSSPIPLLCFPFSYGDSLCGRFVGDGQYCHLMPLGTEGVVVTHADAAGRLLLPEMTIDTVLRVRMRMEYHEKMRPQNSVLEERHSWYSPYCRYPLLESVLVQTIKSSDTVSFAATYYFPQEQVNQPEPKQEQLDSLMTADSLVTDVTYLPNPVYTDLQIHYSLVRPAQVYVSIHYNGGVTTCQTPVRHEEEGAHSVSVSMSGLPVGNYVVYIHADNTVVAGNIVKL